jgi:hypothetical protein
MGKSFEIRPTGVAHADLLLPEHLGPGYPNAAGKLAEGKVVEHYSWKKVTTNVSGFILGAATIDHYGEMTVGCIRSYIIAGYSSPLSAGHEPPHQGSVCAYIQTPRLARERRL